MSNPHDVTAAFERDLAVYTGAPYAIAVNSCTMAILLACAWMRDYLGKEYTKVISLPRRTYIGVPYAVREGLPHAEIIFRDEDWQGEYQITPLPLWDSARRLTEGMWESRAQDYWRPGGNPIVMQAVSFHTSKILGHTQGGAILHNCAEANAWFKRARFDGRTEGVSSVEDVFDMPRAWHAYLSPDVAAALRWKLSSLPRYNADLPRSDYSDLSLAPIFGGTPRE